MVPIIAHVDVRRMLITMRALTRAARTICYATAVALDRAHLAGDAAARQAGQERAALLTPVAKAFSTDIGSEVASLGIQVHGGMGFIEETGAAQHYRDARIAQIYEGTNGIQAIDLVTRKVPMSGGAAVKSYLGELRGTIDAVRSANDPAFGETAARLAAAADSLERATAWLLGALGHEPRCRARRRHLLSAAVRRDRRRLHARRRSAGGRAPRWRRRRRRQARPHRHRQVLRRERRGRRRPLWPQIVTEGADCVLTATAGIGPS